MRNQSFINYELKLYFSGYGLLIDPSQKRSEREGGGVRDRESFPPSLCPSLCLFGDQLRSALMQAKTLFNNNAIHEFREKKHATTLTTPHGGGNNL